MEKVIIGICSGYIPNLAFPEEIVRLQKDFHIIECDELLLYQYKKHNTKYYILV